MDMEKVYNSFAAAMKDFFGFAEGQNLAAFAKEIKELSDVDKQFFRAGLEQNGYKFAA